jgi:hypothetical protein
MAFSTSAMEQEHDHDINSQQNIDVLPLKSNGQRKIWVHMTEFHPIQQSLGMNRLAEFVDRAFQNTPLQPDQ